MEDFANIGYVGAQYLKTYVKHQGSDKCFFVSTINRRDSTPYQMIFSETMAFEFLTMLPSRSDISDGKLGDIVGMFSGCRDSSANHFLCIELLLKHGTTEGYDCDGKKEEANEP